MTIQKVKGKRSQVIINGGVPHVCHRPEEHQGREIYTYPEGSSLPGFSYCRLCWKEHGKREKTCLPEARTRILARLAQLREQVLSELPLKTNSLKVIEALDHAKALILESAQPTEHQKKLLRSRIAQLEDVVTYAGLDPAMIKTLRNEYLGKDTRA